MAIPNTLPAKRVDKLRDLMAFTPILSAEGFVPGALEDSTSGCYNWSAECQRMVPLIAEFAYDYAYDWTTDDAPNVLMSNTEALEQADFAALGRLLFALYRQDKFCENFLYCCFADGTILRILERLETLLEADPQLAVEDILDPTTIQSRLRQMEDPEADPKLRWDETCEGSARALVIFVGPSPGSEKKERRPMKKNNCSALWNESFDQPWNWKGKGWNNGFRIGFRPLVEAILSVPYETAGKLIGRANLDWISNPASKDVDERDMLEGAPSTLKMIEDCAAELVLPMDMNAFNVLTRALENAQFKIVWCHVEKFSVRISENVATPRFNRQLNAFFATSPEGHDFIVMKLPQHPTRLLGVGYARRCGEAMRAAARQMAAGKPVHVFID